MASDAIKTVGYVGLGTMGAPMAANLLKAGFDVTVWNRTSSKCDPLKEQGAKVAKSPADIAEQGPDVILLNVSDTPDVEAVLFGDDGIASKAKEGLIVIDNSTISPVATVEFAARLKEQGVTFLDAPVSGGDIGAQKGTLSIMVGGDEAAFNKSKPVFEAMGKNITLLGPAGTGQACKACNQISVCVNLLATCEAISLAKATGLDLDKMIEVVSGGAGGSWQLANLGPKIAAGDYDPGFMVDLVLKDLNIVNDTAREHHLPLVGTAIAERYFHSVAANGGGRLGTQAMAQTVNKMANQKDGQ